MRYGLLVILGIVLCVELHQGWFAQAYEKATSAALTDEARLAIDVGCRERSARARRECQAMLKKLYLAGSLDPDKTVRAYCDRVKRARWGGSQSSLPGLCAER